MTEAGRGEPGRSRRAGLGGGRSLGLALLVALGLALALEGCGGRRELTIIVISLDTTRPDHLSAYGYDRETTPTLARLAREGVTFSECRSSSSWTLPGHASLFTGLPVPMHRMVMDLDVMDPALPTMGEIFSAADFRTMGFFSAPYVHGRYGFARGMDFYQRCIDPVIWDIPPDRRQERLRALEAASHRQISSHEVVERAVRTLVTRGRPRNLVFMHLFDPHYDFMADRRYTQRFVDPDYTGPIDGRGVFTDDIVTGTGLDAADKQQLRDLYDAELAWTDENLAALLKNLEHEGKLDSTLVVVTSDHGEEFYEHGRFGHRFTLNDEVLRIPLLVWGPSLGVPAGKTIDEPVAIYDVLPTLMDYADIASDDRIFGRSLRPLIEGQPLPPRPTSASLHYFPAESKDHYVLTEALVHQGLKFQRTVQVEWSPQRQMEVDGPEIAGTERTAVFDLTADPGETRDLLAAGDPRAAALVEAHAIEQRRQLEARARLLGETISTPSDDAGITLMESLQAGGYIMGSDSK